MTEETTEADAAAEQVRAEALAAGDTSAEDEAATAALDGEQGDGAEAPTDPLAKVRREAAGYRVKLREAEADRDRLAGLVESMQRQEAERLVGDHRTPRALAEGSDLWRSGVELSELLDENGALDAAKVSAARDRALEQHPHWARRVEGFDGGVRGTLTLPRDPGAGFSDALRRAAD